MNAQIVQKESNVTTVVGVILIILSIVSLFTFVLPSKDNLADLKVDLSEKETELQQIKTEIIKFDALDESFEGSEVTKKDVINLIPETVEENEVIRILADLADEHEVTMNSLSFAMNRGADTDVNTLIINTNVGGGHQDLIKFLESIEEESRKFVVKSISVQTLQNFQENMSLTIEAYFL